MALPKNESFHEDVKIATEAKVVGKEVGLKDDMSPRVPGQTKTSTARVLGQEEPDRPSAERTLVSDFKQMKLEKEAQKNWDLFYKRNTTNFFKDRHWTTREFEELKACREVRDKKKPETPSRYIRRDQILLDCVVLSAACNYFAMNVFNQGVV